MTVEFLMVQHLLFRREVKGKLVRCMSETSSMDGKLRHFRKARWKLVGSIRVVWLITRVEG